MDGWMDGWKILIVNEVMQGVTFKTQFSNNLLLLYKDAIRTRSNSHVKKLS
jgi:hypothetical protein